MTYMDAPQDLEEGRILWAKVLVLTLLGVIVPLTIPRQYSPVDPKVLCVLLKPIHTSKRIILYRTHPRCRAQTRLRL